MLEWHNPRSPNESEGISDAGHQSLLRGGSQQLRSVFGGNQHDKIYIAGGARLTEEGDCHPANDGASVTELRQQPLYGTKRPDERFQIWRKSHG
jgi:hypothetical protein